MENELTVKPLNLLSKIFLSSIVAWVQGKNTNLKLRGNPNEIEIIQNALLASKAFQDELTKPGTTIDSVMSKLSAKQAAAKQFEMIFEFPWPL